MGEINHKQGKCLIAISSVEMCGAESGITQVLKTWAYLWQEIISWLLDFLGHLVSLGWNILVNELLYFEKTDSDFHMLYFAQ